MLGRSLGKYVVKERKIEMAEKKNLLTREGLRKLEDELQDLKVNRRQEMHRISKKQESKETCQRTPVRCCKGRAERYRGSHRRNRQDPEVCRGC